jgi:hypothetical protein
MDFNIILLKESLLRQLFIFMNMKKLEILANLLKYDSSGVLVDSMFEETLVKT